jgi:hypothetical protein
MINPEKLATLDTQDEDKHYYTQTNTNNVNKTRVLLQTTVGLLRNEHRFKLVIIFSVGAYAISFHCRTLKENIYLPVH